MRIRVACVNETPAELDILPAADVIVFPELMDGGYAALERGEGIHRVDDAYLARFRAFSRRRACTCIAGSVALRHADGATTNTCLVYQRGRLIHRYDKIHLFRPAGDSTHFVPGMHAGTFAILTAHGRVRAGVVICYDLRFPEVVRFLAREGVELLCIPARWPALRDVAWQSLLKARAIENQLYVVGCNARGAEGGVSYVFGPSGDRVEGSPHHADERWQCVELDIDALRAARARHSYLEDAIVLEGLAIPRRFKRRSAHRRKPRLRGASPRSRR